MSRLLSFLSLIFVFVFTSLIHAETLWTIGIEDNSHSEFAISGDFDSYVKKFPEGVSMKFDCLKLHEEWSFILPGPVDDWAGKKKHACELSFDFPGLEDLDSPVFQFEIKGWGQGSSPPELRIILNGESHTVRAKAAKTGDAILEDPKGEKSESYKVSILKKNLKREGNIFRIENVSGSWFVFDCMKFIARSGKIEKIEIRPVRGVYRLEDSKFGGRKIEIDYAGDILASEAVLILKTLPDGEETTIKLSPENNASGIDIVLPVPLEDCTKPLELRVAIKTPDTVVTKDIELPSERAWEVFLIHQTHLDIGYTHTQVDVLKRQVQSIKDALKYIEETKDYPEEARFRFHPEGMWAIDEFMKTATEIEKDAFIKAAREKKIHLDVMYAQAMTGMYNDEELFELLAPAIRFGKEHGIPIESAMQTDVPGYTWGLVTALGQNGIKYMSMGPNAGHRVGRLYHWGEKPFYWESQSGKEKVLCWLLDTGYHQFHRHRLGQRITEAEIFDILDGKEWLPHSNEPRKFPYDMIMVRYGIEGDNGRPNRVISDVVKEWNEKYVYPKLILSSNSEAMAELEKRHGKDIPTIRGDYSPYWEDGCISTTAATGLNRRSCEKILQAQALWAMLSPEKWPVELYDEAYINLIMYDEHTWGAHNSISQPDSDFVKQQDEYKQNYARKGAAQVDELFKKAIAPRIVDSNVIEVFNTTTRDRWGVVSVPWNDTLRKLAKKGDNFYAKSGERKFPMVPTEEGLFFTVAYVQPFGSMLLEIVNEPENPKKKSVHVDLENFTISNELLVLKLDPNTGSIASLRRKDTDHDFIKPGAGGNAGANDLLYIIGRDAKENNMRIKGGVRFTGHSAEDGSVFDEIIVETDAPGCDSFKRIYRLYAKNDKIEIRNIIRKKMERRPEGLFFAFPFNIPGGKWYLDEPFSLVVPEEDQLPGANRNYYCIQRYAMLANEEMGIDIIPLEGNMFQFDPVLFAPAWSRENTEWREKIEPDGTIYSWVCNNHWETNYKAGQDDVIDFTYVLCPYVASPEHGIAQHLAREAHQPMFAVSVDPKRFETEKESTGLLKLDNPWIAVSACRPARDMSGDIIVRIYNPSDRDEEVRVLFTKERDIFFTNTLEEKLEKQEKSIKLAPKETKVFRASLK